MTNDLMAPSPSIAEIIIAVHKLFPTDCFYDGSVIPKIQKGDKVMCLDNLGVTGAPDIVIRYWDVPPDSVADIVEDSTCWQTINTLLDAGMATKGIMAKFGWVAESKKPEWGIFADIRFQLEYVDTINFGPGFKSPIFASIKICPAKNEPEWVSDVYAGLKRARFNFPELAQVF